MSPERQELIRVKLLVLEYYQAEAEVARFLTECLGKYGSLLSMDESLKAAELVSRVTALIAKLRASDANYHPKDSDDNLPAPLGVLQVGFENHS